MSIESCIFRKCKANYDKLLRYGFIKNKDKYIYKKFIINNNFSVVITIINNSVKGIIYDNDTGDEYINYRIKEQNGEFVNRVRECYKNVLLDIYDNCFDKDYFISRQANRIANKIKKKYNILPEFLWDKYPDIGVFRNKRSNKWFGIIMNVDGNKIVDNYSGEIDVLNIKLDGEVDNYKDNIGIYEAYHMNKNNWVSIILDDTLTDDEVINLIDISYGISNIKRMWIVPVNFKKFDIIGALNENDIIFLRQYKKILVDDIIYIYVSDPYSSIMYKCIVLESNISYSCKNISISDGLKVKVLRSYKRDDLSFSKLKLYGIKSIKGPRNITSELYLELRKFD